MKQGVKKKSVLPSKTRMKNSIRKVYQSMTVDFFNANKDWYWDCHKWCQELADEKGVDLMCVCSVFSILSPQCSYNQNKVFCRLFFDGIRKQTFTQHDKALRILQLYGVDSYELRKEQSIRIINGSKTTNFFINILEPWNKKACTIDRHALIIAGVTRSTVTPSQYELVKEAYVELAGDLGILSAELQASTWCKYRLDKFGQEHNYG